MDEEKLEENNQENDEIGKDVIIRPLKITGRKSKCMKIDMSRFTSPTKRYGSSTSVCTKKGELTRIYTTFNNYNRTSKLVKVYPGCYYIKAKYNKNGHTVVIYQISSISIPAGTLTLNKVATYSGKKWDNTELLSALKPAIASTVKKAKKYYYFTNIE